MEEDCLCCGLKNTMLNGKCLISKKTVQHAQKDKVYFIAKMAKRNKALKVT